MDGIVKQFGDIVGAAGKILITSHISPDPDAICSTLLLGITLQLNFPDKKIAMILEEKPAKDLSFLASFKDIKFDNLLDSTERLRPDLFIIVDAMNFDRVSRSQGLELKKLISEKLIAKLLIIDHHTEIGLDKSDLYINHHQPATVQEIYSLMFKDLELKKPAGYAQTALLGIITDTNRFLYHDPSHRQTFAVVSQLLDAGANVEELENQLGRYNKSEMMVLSDLSKNITDSGLGYSYSFVDDEIGDKLLQRDPKSLKTACGFFVDEFIRKFENNLWGFVVYPELTNGKKTYSVSFRAVGGHKNVAEIAARLGGGGHEPAAGAKGLEAADVKSAVKLVRSVIEDNSSGLVK